ncbi:MAG TPA: hypothetical protein PLQ56_20950 [Aggregatilineales bacterium]|nr:hypothetical protein [Aggregatilineales bacterium]
MRVNLHLRLGAFVLRAPDRGAASGCGSPHPLARRVLCTAASVPAPKAAAP